MTIRDLLSINSAWFHDYITILKKGNTILRLMPIAELHPIWLEYEVENYYLLPHKEDEVTSCYSCDYLITIGGITLFQQKTDLDKELYENYNERIKDNESTNNN